MLGYRVVVLLLYSITLKCDMPKGTFRSPSLAAKKLRSGRGIEHVDLSRISSRV